MNIFCFDISFILYLYITVSEIAESRKFSRVLTIKKWKKKINNRQIKNFLCK